MDQNLPPKPNYTPQFQTKSKGEISSLKLHVEKEVASISRRVKIVEEHIDTLSSRLQLEERDTIEKHKASIKRISQIEEEMRVIKSKLNELNELVLRVANRLKDFAPKEDIDVLQKYIKWWQPLNYVTREEVKNLIKEERDNKKR